MNRKGVFSLYDAVLFFVFLLIASSVLTFYTSTNIDRIEERDHLSDYCRKTRRAILSSTIPETGYHYSEGYVNRTDITVRRLLIEQVQLESSGIDRENFSYAEDISRLIDQHISERHNWFLQVSSASTEDILIGEQGLLEETDLQKHLGNDVVSSSWYEEGTDIMISFYLSD